MFDIVDLTERHRRAAQADLSELSDDELFAAVVELQRDRACLDAFEGHLLAEIDVREREADRQYRQHSRDHDRTGGELPVPPRATLMALGLTELIRHGLARDPDDTRAPVTDLTLVITAQPGPPIPIDPTGRPLHPDTPTPVFRPNDRPDDRPPDLTHEHAEPHDDGCCRSPGLFDDVATPDGEPVAADTVRHLLCDPRYIALITNTLGVPLDIGRDRRLPTPAQRRALTQRDGGCTFPGCDQPPSWCDAHHVIAWEHLGPTELWNLALLCRHHHGVTHRNGWTMTTTPGQHFTWTTPTGHTLHSQRHRGRPRRSLRPFDRRSGRGRELLHHAGDEQPPDVEAGSRRT